MAFNFNWSPLIADTSRAREMLTAALNKSPKPPIIVDDIVVTELNLGSVPPKLDILEIGDLAVDRFRGIFKMQYSGDAYLTLKTRVQANPLDTYLSTRPDFVSPDPLAAASGLKIPLQITLSEIKLSGFVILVFSKQKGITLVFRNDPLESIKVSSTFDSISFIRNYLQKRLEAQLRQLFMEDLPVIIHRLSLRVWPGPDHFADVNSNIKRHSAVLDAEIKPIDPLATPSLHPTEGVSELDFDSLSLNSADPSQAYPSFSQKNLLRLAALTDSHRTLSLFTPPIHDVVFRAWAGAAEKGELRQTGPMSIATPSFKALSSVGPLQRRSTGAASSASSYTMSDAAAPSVASAPTGPTSRPSLAALQSMHSSTSYSPSMLGRSRPHGGRKRKNRVVNLRKKAEVEDDTPAETTITPSEELQMEPMDDYISERPSTPTSTDPPSSIGEPFVPRVYEGEIETAPNSPEKPLIDQRTPRPALQRPATESNILNTPTLAASNNTPAFISLDDAMATEHPAFTYRSHHHRHHYHRPRTSTLSSVEKEGLLRQDMTSAGAPGGILEQAWMMKMATEIARKVAMEKRGESSTGSFWDGVEDAPPAYTSE